MNIEEQAIRDLFNQKTQAIKERDAERAVKSYDENVVSFEADSVLDAKNVDKLFSNSDGPIENTYEDLTVKTFGDLAYVYGYYHIKGSMLSEGESDTKIRMTAVLEKVGGEWKIVHEHTSIPKVLSGANTQAEDRSVH